MANMHNNIRSIEFKHTDSEFLQGENACHLVTYDDFKKYK